MDETKDQPLGATEPEQSTTAAATAGAGAKWIRHFWGLIVAVVVPAVTLATVVIPLVAEASIRLTSADTLVVMSEEDHAQPAPAASPAAPETDAARATLASFGSQELVGASVPEQFPDGYWRVPSTAPWKTLPLNTSDSRSCAPEQIAWLEQWGRRNLADVWNGYLSLTNSATDGTPMSVRNIHSVGVFTEPAVPEVDVECVLGIGGGSEIIPIRQDLGSDNPAVFAYDYRDFPAGTPVTLNIAPGEYLQLITLFNSDPNRTSDFAGDFVADVVIGEETTEVTLFKGLTRQGVAGIRSTRLAIDGNSITCGPDGRQTCTIDEFVSQVTSDPSYRSN